MTFTLYPAIDLRHGRVVRLSQGEVSRETVYEADLLTVATEFAAQGATWLHVVNLDGAFGEASPNLGLLKLLCAKIKIPVQFGGGLRNEAAIEQALEIGVSRVILGTVALKEPELIRRLAPKLGERLVVGIDARDGLVAVEGWVKASNVGAEELVKQMLDVGVCRFVYTDIARDGMMVGPDLMGAARLASLGAKVIASGGVGKLEHVMAAGCAGAGVEGLIVGKALYEGRFTLRDALDAIKVNNVNRNRT